MQLVKECIVTLACYSSMLAVQRLRNCACEIQFADIVVLLPSGALHATGCNEKQILC